MSLRCFSVRLYKNGRYVLRALYQGRALTASISDGSALEGRAAVRAGRSALPGEGYQVGAQARRLFVDTVLNRVTTCVAADLRRKAARRLIFGDSVPFFALVGMSLATGAGVLTREDDMEGLCLEIRDAISKFQWSSVSVDVNEGVFAMEEITLDRLTIGYPIAKGCSAIVYAAKLKEDTDSNGTTTQEDADTLTNTNPAPNLLSDCSMYPLALKMMFNYDIQSNAMSILRAMYRETVPARRYLANDQTASWESMFVERRVALPPHPNIVAMYNVFAEHVLRLAGSMRLYPAALPARLNPDGFGRNMSLFLLMKRFVERRVALPPHPNIVAMYSVFAERVPRLAGSMRLYPAALPARLNPDGFGRNMSLFLLVKRFVERRVALPPHPNIVAMYSVFAERVPRLAGSMRLYPAALPARLNPDGFGRNMSLFLLMKRLIFGDSVPFFALVGVSLATGAGVLTREDELEGLCLEIRDAISKFQWSSVSVDVNEGVFAMEEITLDRLTIGYPIAKGCSAIVYAAKLKEDTDSNGTTTQEDADTLTNTNPAPNLLSDCSMYPLALKMMFNYDIQSNAMSILRAMYRETVPARRYLANDQTASWESMFVERRVALPPHPNIVAMYSVFAERVPRLAGSMRLYPAALPARLNPDGFGRNMSLFLLMKRYQYSLADYLRQQRVSPRGCVLLLAQLLEAVTHINMYGVAHRDLKSDNILVDALFSEGESTVPVLVVTDFGCCLADYVNGLQIPFNSEQIDKGGNAALMAPEIANQMPGPFSVLNYTKSDVWAAGAIAYEIFGSDNPFYRSASKEARPMLRNNSYKDCQLPELSGEVPDLMRRLVRSMLARNPNKRPTPEVAANVCQLYLWAPSQWVKSSRMPSSTEIIQWLLCLTTKVLYEGRLPDSYREGGHDAAPPPPPPRVTAVATSKSARRTHPEYVLISSFLGRARLAQIKQALLWIQSCNA